MLLSQRAQSLGTENAFVVLAEVTALQRAGQDIISFCIGQPDFPAPSNIQEAGIKAIRQGKHGYTPSAGIPELREAAAREINRMRGLAGPSAITPDDVVIGGGAKPFIAYAILSTTDYGMGDEVIYPNPGFPIYESQIVANGAKPVPLGLKEARDFAFDPNELEAKITPKTKLLILNTPHNPTGGILSKQDLSDIASILRRHPNVWIYADEIYSRLIYDGAFASITAHEDMIAKLVSSSVAIDCNTSMSIADTDVSEDPFAEIITGSASNYCSSEPEVPGALSLGFTRTIEATDSVLSYGSRSDSVDLSRRRSQGAARLPGT